jgi:superfamily I DNA and RNA helicase
MGNNWPNELNASIRNSKINVVGQDDVKNEAQANVAIAIIKAYGDSPAGFVYIEPYTTRSTKRPPDVLLCHPNVGVLVIEVKGYSLDIIEGTEAGKLDVRMGGYNRRVDIFSQAADSMFQIKNDTDRITRREYGRGHPTPLFNYMAALPNVSESDWRSKGYKLPEGEILFKEQIETTQRLKQRVSMLIQNSLASSHKESPLDIQQIQIVERVLGKSSTINEKRAPRSWVDERKLGAYIDEMAALDKYTSSEQRELSRLKIDGYPRLIRGVAGSGKTIVLAEMVARLVNRQAIAPDDMFEKKSKKTRLAVICYNKSLVPFLQQKIRASYEQQTSEKLPSGTVEITHFNGLPWELGKQNILKYLSVKEYEDNAQRALLYRDQLKEFSTKNSEWHDAILYDAIFIDEGQDLESTEFQLLLDLIKPNSQTGEKALIIFYDDAQNLYARTRPIWKEIGVDVQRGDRARVMKKSFRSTREVVELAFNVLLGSQSPPDIRVQTRTYADVSYLKQQGLIEEHGDHFRVLFAERTFKKPKIKKFSSRFQEKQWIAEEIAKLIQDEKVRPEDILLLFHSSVEFSDLSDMIMKKTEAGLIQGFLKPYGRGNKADQDTYIFRKNHLTISTTFGAKGYDAQIVFLVGVDQFSTDKKGRASFYVGATRSKMLLYLSGLDNSETLLTEAEVVNSVV